MLVIILVGIRGQRGRYGRWGRGRVVFRSFVLFAFLIFIFLKLLFDSLAGILFCPFDPILVSVVGYESCKREKYDA